MTSPLLSSFLSSYLSEPYEWGDSPGPAAAAAAAAATPITRYDPYAAPPPSACALSEFFPHLPSSSPSTLPSLPTPPTSACLPATKKRGGAAPPQGIKYKHVKKGELVRPLEDYGVFDPSAVLPEDPTLARFKDDDKYVFWYYILSLLVDPRKKGAVAWTGRGTEFVITSPDTLTALWSREQGLSGLVKFESIRRNLRACYKRRIMRPTDAKKNKFAFCTEPSIHVSFSRSELTTFIALHNLEGPLTVGGPLPSDLPMDRFPAGAPLQVFPPLPLNADGSLAVALPTHLTTVPSPCSSSDTVPVSPYSTPSFDPYSLPSCSPQSDISLPISSSSSLTSISSPPPTVVTPLPSVSLPPPTVSTLPSVTLPLTPQPDSSYYHDYSVPFLPPPQFDLYPPYWFPPNFTVQAPFYGNLDYYGQFSG